MQTFRKRLKRLFIITINAFLSRLNYRHEFHELLSSKLKGFLF
jgi:hypothetical protein